MARPRIVVVGLGPAGPDLLSAAAAAALDPSLGPVVLRTARHPAAAALQPARSFDHLYETHPDRPSLYAAITDALLEEAIECAARLPGGRLAYAVPGSPVVAERSVELLLHLAPSRGVDVELVPGLSFLDLAWGRLMLDPIAAGVRLVDGESFAEQAAGQRGPFLVSHCWNAAVLSGLKLSVEDPDPSATAILLHHLGLEDEVVVEVPWAELDRTIEPDHLTSAFVRALAAPVAGELVALSETAAVLRQRCPWDRVQTHRSLVRHLLEESYETMEAIENLPDEPAAASAGQASHLEEELGDLLFQVLFHCLLAAEEGLFNLADVARRLNDKLVARHPHVFGDALAGTAEEVHGQWERRKQLEKGRYHLFDGIPVAMPALARAAKFERKLSSVGLGLRLRTGPAEGDELRAGEQLLELSRALAAAGIDPEAALRLALERLAAVVARLETRAARQDLRLADVPPETLEEWLGADRA